MRYPPTKYLARMIQDAAEARGWTKSDLARESGVSYTVVSEAWRGITVPSADTTTRLTEAFNSVPGVPTVETWDLRAAAVADLVAWETAGQTLTMKRVAQLLLG